MNAYTVSLVNSGIIVCPGCEENLVHGNNSLTCRNCVMSWPVRNGVPDLFNEYETSADVLREGHGNANLARTILKALDLPESAYTNVLEIVARASNWSSSRDEITAEINDLEDRFSAGSDVQHPPVDADANREPKFRIERHYFPPSWSSRESSAANVRITNAGRYSWSSRAPQPIQLVAYWRSLGLAARRVRAGTTRLPVDIIPGRSISLPIRVKAPLFSGRYCFTVALEQDGKRVSEEQILIPEAQVTSGLFGRKKTRTTQHINGFMPLFLDDIADYGEDHNVGVSLVQERLAALGKSTCTILEVGSGTHPQTAWLPECRVLALDISSGLLELGNLFFREKRPSSSLGFLCADAFAAPIKRGSFDCVAIFSSLHHFAEPDVLLAKLATLLTDDGFLSVMCEPVNDSLEHPATVRDLLKGVNEQVFTWQEYLRIFDAAGLEVEHMQIDGGSLKAILRVS